MDSRFRAAEVERVVATYAPLLGPDLALRLYTAHLLAEDAELVLHRGGSASLKAREVDLFGETSDVLYISGDDEELATITPRGFAACDLASLRRLAERPGTGEEEALAEIARRTRGPAAPAPSAYALVHAALPGKYVDHAQADTILTIVNQPGGANVVSEIYGERALYVPYMPPGAALARRVLEAARAAASTGAKPSLLIADRNGIFTWGETAQESYELLIAAVSRAERYVAEMRIPGSRRTISAPDPDFYVTVAPIARGVLEEVSRRPWILTWRTSPQMRAFCERIDMTILAQFGSAAPDHTPLTKPRPLVVGELKPASAAVLRKRISGAVSDYAAAYDEYVRKGEARKGAQQKALDPWPRVMLFEGLGALVAAADAADAEAAADVYEHTAAIIDVAHTLQGYFPASEAALFDAEHGAAARARAARKEAMPARSLDRRIALVTGGASGVGLAAARGLLRAGAHVVLVDKNEAGLEQAAKGLEVDHPQRVARIACDVATEAQARRAVSHACMCFGGLDILVSDAGSARAMETGALHTSAGPLALKAAVEPILSIHQSIARAAAEVMLLQETGGALLFVTSNCARGTGPDAGPGLVADAALIALMRAYALELGPHGIRCNAVSAGLSKSELSSGGASDVREGAKTATTDEPPRTNLLGREPTAEDAAAALVFLASASATTGCVVTVDSGGPQGGGQCRG